jgi:hypothetical protein
METLPGLEGAPDDFFKSKSTLSESQRWLLRFCSAEALTMGLSGLIAKDGYTRMHNIWESAKQVNLAAGIHAEPFTYGSYAYIAALGETTLGLTGIAAAAAIPLAYYTYYKSLPLLQRIKHRLPIMESKRTRTEKAHIQVGQWLSDSSLVEDVAQALVNAKSDRL